MRWERQEQIWNIQARMFADHHNAMVSQETTQKKKNFLGIILAALVMIFAVGVGVELWQVIQNMNRSMTSMASDMSSMKGDMSTMSVNMTTMSKDMSTMNKNMATMSSDMSQMNLSMGAMLFDTGVMRHGVYNRPYRKPPT
ncbi:hypothetical protein CCP3SC1_1140003 [Gammaproteobacteria bacterium]